jgi:predicted enzyme related to lactoylglutathione lyase
MGNAVAWFEVLGTDGAKLREFYAALFDWKIAVDDSGMDYGLVEAETPGIAGGIGRSPDGGPGHVTFYVEVDDVRACLDRAERLGATTVSPPMDVPGWNLTVALFADPDGHLVGLSKGATAGGEGERS